MNKTIEELAKQFTDELFAEDDLTDFDTQTEKNDAYVTCMAFGNYLMGQSLSFRLTAKEKERVRKMYKELSECIENRTADVEYLKGKRCQLVIIFGADLFKEEE